MAKELIISLNGREKKIAIIENEKVTEFYIERGETNQGIVGNIYKGRVMRVLPGMQSAFVDIGLERDAFLYVSDFFDEEEEFERIVIDKTKQGAGPTAEREAAEQIAQDRVEREQRIEATHARVDPLLDEPSDAVEVEEALEPVAEVRPKGRRGRGRGRSSEHREDDRVLTPRTYEETEAIITPFVSGDPSIERIIDDDEAAAVSGEMFKDARLQERIFDQIHAGEFDDSEDPRTAEVGSILPVDYSDPSFQRVEDSDGTAALETSRRRRAIVAARLESFSDEAVAPLAGSQSFERVIDEEEAARVAALASGEGTNEVEPSDGDTEAPATAPKKRRRRPTARKAAKRPAASAKTSASDEAEAGSSDDVAEESEAGTDEVYEDSEADVTDGSRAEFATRRGGRRRRRPNKPKTAAGETPGEAEGESEAVDAPEIEDEDAPPEPMVVEAPEPVEQAPASEPREHEPRGREPRGREPRDAGPRDRDTSRDRERRPSGGSGGRGRGFSRNERQQPTITDLLSAGQEILVQIAKEPIAKKGARITSHIALPGRFLVYMPTVEHVGVSRKIESDMERHRLRKIIQTLRAEEDVPSGGFIVRTAGVGISEKDLRLDVRYLVRTWLDIRKAAEKAKAPALVHSDLGLVQRILRDQLSNDFEAIRVDSEEEYQRIVEFINRIQPQMVRRVKLYTREQPILEAYGVQAEIDKAIKPRVWLRSGGYLVINQTEALVAIDVNTGKFVGRGSGRLEDTITRTNLEAVDEIVRQIRLRDLGGIIVLDLIDMEERRNRQRVMGALQDALRFDKSPTKVLSFNDFGLVIMTRKRVKQSLERVMCSPCQYCQGAGLIKSPQTISYEILEVARSLGRDKDGGNKQATLRINPEVARTLRGPERDVLTEIEDYLGPVDITSDASVHQEQFDFAFI